MILATTQWLVKIKSHDSQLAKNDFRRDDTRFEECFLFDFDVVRSEIIIKSSFEIYHIVDKWWCCCRRCWRWKDEKIDLKVRKVVIVDKVAVKHVNQKRRNLALIMIYLLKFRDLVLLLPIFFFSRRDLFFCPSCSASRASHFPRLKSN
jgi:hypothetical protein